MLIKRFLAYLPKEGCGDALQMKDRGAGNQRGLSREAFRTLKWAEGHGLEVMHSGYVLGFEGYGKSDGTTEAHRQHPDRILLHVPPGAAASRIASETGALPPSEEAWDAWAERRVELYTLLCANPTEIRIFSDILALLPFWMGDLEEGTVVASSIYDLLSVFPELARPFDPVGVVRYLVGGRSPRTVHARIRASAAGTTLHWTKHEGFRATRDRRLVPVPLRPDLRTEEAIEEVVALHAEKLRDFLVEEEECLLTLTGGFDSRLIACVLKEEKLPVRTATLGNRHHSEVKVAQLTARMLGLPHEILEPRGDLLDQVPIWLKVLGGHSGYGTFFITELLNRGYPKGMPILTGLLGGNLAYGGGYWTSPEVGETVETMARYLVSWILADLQPGFSATLGIPGAEEALVEEIRANLVPAETSLHTMFIYDMEFRQPRGVGAIAVYLGEEYRVGMPFLSRKQIRSWMSLPRIAHENRRLLRWIFEKRYPQFAAIPHAEEAPRVLPNSTTSLIHQFQLFGNRGVDAVLRRTLGHDRRAGRRYVWTLWHGWTPQQVRRQMDALKVKSQAIGEVLGWIPEGDEREPFWDRIATKPHRTAQIRTAFYLLAEYCDWLKRTIPGV